MITPDSTLSRSGDLVSAPLGEELAMMDMASGTYYVLDEVAAFIWETLATPTRTDSLLAALQGRYDVVPERCVADVMPFLERLHAKGLVRILE